MSSQAASEVTWLYLVRHGATEANERIPYVLQGNAMDLPLSAAGERQAQAVADFLPQFPIKHVYSSGMLRARQTAQAIARRLDLSPGVAAELHECNVGEWEGLDWKTIKERFPEAHRKFVDNPAENAYLGGESYSDVLRRTKPAFERLLDAHAGESIAVVAHNVVNRAFLSHLLGLDPRMAPKIAQANCCVNLIRRRAGQRMELLTLNGVFHLGPFYLTGGPAG
ncbi:MAG TPA: histidine phosphatase family protein [Planctomycetaceae bacterium]